MLLIDEQSLIKADSRNVVKNEEYYLRWINWIQLIYKQHQKHRLTHYIKNHFLRHLTECLDIDQSSLNNLNFQKKINSLINLFYIYYFCFKKKMDLNFSIYKYYNNTNKAKFNYYNIIQKIINFIEKTESICLERANYKNIIILQRIFYLIMKICNYYSFRIDYSQLVERLINFQNKRNQPFIVHEDGKISIY